MNFKFIINPKTNRAVSIYGKKGKQILLNYINILQIGSAYNIFRGKKSNSTVSRGNKQLGKIIKYKYELVYTKDLIPNKQYELHYNGNLMFPIKLPIIVYGSDNAKQVQYKNWPKKKVKYMEQIIDYKDNKYKKIFFIDDSINNCEEMHKKLKNVVNVFNVQQPYGLLNPINQHNLKLKNFLLQQKDSVIVFDFDQTLINIHTGGYPDVETFFKTGILKGRNSPHTESYQYIRILKQFLNILLKKNNRLYIITRGIEKDVQMIINILIGIPIEILFARHAPLLRADTFQTVRRYPDERGYFVKNCSRNDCSGSNIENL